MVQHWGVRVRRAVHWGVRVAWCSTGAAQQATRARAGHPMRLHAHAQPGPHAVVVGSCPSACARAVLAICAYPLCLPPCACPLRPRTCVRSPGLMLVNAGIVKQTAGMVDRLDQVGGGNDAGGGGGAQWWWWWWAQWCWWWWWWVACVRGTGSFVGLVLSHLVALGWVVGARTQRRQPACGLRGACSGCALTCVCAHRVERHASVPCVSTPTC